MFNIGDIICKDESSVPYTVGEIDIISGPMPKYKLTQGNFSFWDYCIGWEKMVESDDALRYGNILTDDMFEKRVIDDSGWDLIRTDYVRIRTISYDNRIFYHKMVNGEVIKFKELTV